MTNDGNVTITWLGHATTQIVTPTGKTILIDPFLTDNPSTPEHLKSVENVDLMLITHGHFDHIADAVSIVQQTGCSVVAIYEICSYLGKKGVTSCTGINMGGTVRWEGVEITLVQAVHSSTITDGDQTFPGGEAGGFVIKLENGFVIYQSGDTAVFEGMALIGRLYRPDVAILPIGDHFTMGPAQAAEAIRMLDVDAVIPIHWGTFPVLTGTPAALKERTKGISGLKILAIDPGESVTQGQMV
jgi:L-ascorbate metabolism protein UlaG (beta-lactamase superfamily)